jgi:hypothetical protein
VPRLRLRRVTRPHACGADGMSCGSSGTRDVATGGLAGALMPGGMGTRDAVCHRYPQFATIHGLAVSRGYRGDGRAPDCMISESAIGWNIANRIDGNAKKLGVSEVICWQCIWTVQPSSEGCVRMSDRGSPIANRTYTWTSPSTATAQHAN